MLQPNNNTVYTAALYCRLSKDDGFSDRDSSSIETQRTLLTNYCNEHGIIIHDYYVDDGYTGTNFDRPSFQRMIGDIENGKINCVITKDQSRLGRNHLEAGYFIEKPRLC
jgi:DNA invertase Pin-like site-specific DNA recombinase